MEQTNVTTAIKTICSGIGDITSLVFNPHDGCFYGCKPTSKSIIKIKGIICLIEQFNESSCL